MGIKGVPVVLYEKQVVGTDDFGADICEEIPVTIENVLIAPVMSDDATSRVDLNSDKCSYKLAIPKGDDHQWRNNLVEFFGSKFRVVGKPTQGMEEMIPLNWNKQVEVEEYE